MYTVFEQAYCDRSPTDPNKLKSATMISVHFLIKNN